MNGSRDKGIDAGLVVACSPDGVTLSRTVAARLVSHWSQRHLSPPVLKSDRTQSQLAIGDRLIGRVTRIDRPRRAIFVDLGHGATGMVSTRQFAGSEGDRLHLRLVETGEADKQPRLTIVAVSVPLSQPLGLLARGSDGLDRMLLSLAAGDRIITNDGETKARLAQRLGALGRPELLDGLELRLVSADELRHQTGVSDQWAEAQERVQPQPNRSRLILEETATLQIIDVDRGGCDLTTVELNSDLAAEIARLIGLRRWGGLIVIDYLRMKQDREREQVWKSLRNQTLADGSGWALHGFTRAGLFEITRSRGLSG